MNTSTRDIARAFAMGLEETYHPPEALKKMDEFIELLQVLPITLKAAAGLAEDGIEEYAQFDADRAHTAAALLTNLEDRLCIQRDKMRAAVTKPPLTLGATTTAAALARATPQELCTALVMAGAGPAMVDTAYNNGRDALVFIAAGYCNEAAKKEDG